MQVQELKAGKTTIKIEIAENLEDAEEHKFNSGEYSRYLVNGKLVSYMEMIKQIVINSQVNMKSLIPSKQELQKLQSTLMENQKNKMIENLTSMRDEYKSGGAPAAVIADIDAKIKSININGVRDRE